MDDLCNLAKLSTFTPTLEITTVFQMENQLNGKTTYDARGYAQRNNNNDVQALTPLFQGKLQKSNFLLVNE